MRVLVVEDDVISAELLVNSLRGFGYDVTVATNGHEALDLVRTGRFRLVVSDWEMPEMGGLELCREIRCRQWSSYIYVILLTSFSGVKNVVEGLNAGADDFLTKPFHPEEIRVRLRGVERLLTLESRDITIFALAKLTESRDVETGGHVDRMREYCRLLAEELSGWGRYRHQLDGDYVQLLYLTSPLHDIGKVGIPDSILLKPGKLTPEEFEVMKQHAVIGGRTLEAAARAHPEAEFLHMAREIAMTHHERYDGTGYPNRLAGEQIPLCGRITALADVYDALTSRRIYKAAIEHQAARSIIVEGSGTQFDPDVVGAFLNREQDFIAVQNQFSAAGAPVDVGPLLPAVVPVPAAV